MIPEYPILTNHWGDIAKLQEETYPEPLKVEYSDQEEYFRQEVYTSLATQIG